MSRLGTRGQSLVEAVTAVAVLTVASLTTASTLTNAMQARVVAGRRARAAFLAAGGLERLRAGQTPPSTPTDDGFTLTTAATAWPAVLGDAAIPRLGRLEVRVVWNDGTQQELRLATLVRQ